MTTFRADLHCHSCYSDGTDTPQQLIDLAIASGLSGLSITDHDTVGAYEVAFPYAATKDFPLLVGVEFSASYQGDPVHILGYGFSLDSPAIQALCQRHQTRRQERNSNILEKLDGMGIHLNPEELTGKTIGRPHIALLLMKQGVVKTIKEAFDRYLGEGKLAYDPGTPVSVEETIETIHAGNGKAMIAHPHLLKKRATINFVLQQPFDGLEGYYARFAPNQEQKWVNIAKEKNWLITGGSDYHGSVKPQNQLGTSWVGKETFDALKR